MMKRSLLASVVAVVLAVASGPARVGLQLVCLLDALSDTVGGSTCSYTVAHDPSCECEASVCSEGADGICPPTGGHDCKFASTSEFCGTMTVQAAPCGIGGCGTAHSVCGGTVGQTEVNPCPD